MWNNTHIHASVLCKEHRAIHMLVHDPTNQKNLIVSRVYGPTRNREKDHFWANLAQLNDVIDNPWCIVGDFNKLEMQAKKKGGNLVSARRTERLSSFLSFIQGESILIKGQPFTWKRRVNDSWIYKRLDRGIARFDFARLYPNLCTSHGSFTFSDHCPIIVST